MPPYSYIIDTPDGKKRVDLDGPVPDSAAMEYALGPPQPRPNPQPTPGFPGGSLEQALNPDYGGLATVLRMAAPMLGGMAGPAGAGIGSAMAEPFARGLEGQSMLPSLEEIAGRLPSYEQLQTPEGQSQLVDSMIESFPGSMEAGVVMKNSKRALPFTGAPWEGVEGTKTIPLRRPHAFLPADMIPEHLAQSAARDEQGNLIRVYHGTRGLDDTKALDPDLLSEPWFGESGGLYTTEQPSLTTGYSVRERAKNFELNLEQDARMAKKYDPAQRINKTKREVKKLVGEGVTPQTAPYTYKDINAELADARKTSRYGPGTIPGVNRSDVTNRRPQTRAAYLDIRQPFHVEKSMPREQAIKYLDSMLPQGVGGPDHGMIDEILEDLSMNIADPLVVGVKPNSAANYVKTSWLHSSYHPQAVEIADTLSHPAVNLAFKRFYKMANDHENYSTDALMDMRDQFTAAVKAYLPRKELPREQVIPQLLIKELLGSDTHTRKDITGGEVLRVLKRNGVDTRAALTAAGYDGITHIGGGPPAHRVWIAFRPDQIFDAIPVEAHAEQMSKAIPPTNRPVIAPHSVIGGPIWKQPLPSEKGKP